MKKHAYIRGMELVWPTLPPVGGTIGATGETEPPELDRRLIMFDEVEVLEEEFDELDAEEIAVIEFREYAAQIRERDFEVEEDDD